RAGTAGACTPHGEIAASRGIPCPDTGCRGPRVRPSPPRRTQALLRFLRRRAAIVRMCRPRVRQAEPETVPWRSSGLRGGSPEGRALGAAVVGGRGKAGGVLVVERGRSIVKVVPLPGVLRAAMVPPCASTIARAIARPRPLPPPSARRARDL